jgi:hypothetical protein
MVKSRRKPVSVSAGTLFAAGLVIALAAYGLAGDQIKDSASSLLAAANKGTTTRTVLVTAPAMSETWVHGTSHTITWTGTGSMPVTVWLLNSGRNIPATKLSTNNTKGTFTWVVPSSLLPDTYYVRVSCVDCSGKGQSSFDDAPPITIASVGAPTIAASVGGSSAVVYAAETSGDVDRAEFVLPFTVTAGQAPIWIGRATTRALATTLANKGVLYATTSKSTRGGTTMPVAVLSANDAYAEDTTTAFYVPANASRDFDLYVTVSALAGSSGAYVEFVLRAINYSLTSTMGNSYYQPASLSGSATGVVMIRAR